MSDIYRIKYVQKNGELKTEYEEFLIGVCDNPPKEFISTLGKALTNFESTQYFKVFGSDKDAKATIKYTNVREPILEVTWEDCIPGKSEMYKLSASQKPELITFQNDDFEKDLITHCTYSEQPEPGTEITCNLFAEGDTPENIRAFNVAAREEMKLKLLKDIMFDMQVCQIEGWDPLEFIRDLRGMLNSFTPELS